MVQYRRHQATSVLAAAERAAEHWLHAGAGPHEQANAVRLRGIGYELQKDYPAAIATYRQAIDLWRSLDPESASVASGLSDLADVQRMSGDYAVAERDYREALRIAQKLDDRSGIVTFTGNLAALALDRQDWSAAETLARTALQRSENLGRQELIASNCGRIAQALARQGKLQDGLPYARRAVEIYTQLSSPDLAEAQETLQKCLAGEG